MLTRIVHHSPKLCNFALLVCEGRKTLSALQRQFIEAPDVSNMADFLRLSPWYADDVRQAVRLDQVKWGWMKILVPSTVLPAMEPSQGWAEKKISACFSP